MCVAVIFVLYSVGLAIILLRSPDILSEQRRENISTAFGYVFFVVPLLIFEVIFLIFFKYTLMYFLLILIAGTTPFFGFRDLLHGKFEAHLK